MNYLVSAALIAEVNTFVPAHLQLPEEDQLVPDFLIQEWIAAMTGNPAAQDTIDALNAILAGDPAPEDPVPQTLTVFVDISGRIAVEDGALDPDVTYYTLELTPLQQAASSLVPKKGKNDK